VVASILINATWQGKTVLFASKNNKAVDVVEIRVNALGPRPVLLRMGANEYQAKLAEYLISLLAASATPSDQSKFEEASSAHDKLRAQFRQLEIKIAETIKLRNEVDQLEQKVEPVRAMLGDNVFASFRELDLEKCLAAFNDLQISVIRASKKEQSFGVRIFWPLVRKERFKELREVSIRFRGTADNLSLMLPPNELSDSTIPDWERLTSSAKVRIFEASQVVQYFHKLIELNAAAPVEQISEEKMKLAEEMEETSSLLWDKWLRLQPKRLTQKERAIISEYVSLLKMIIVANDSGQKLGSHVFHKYHQLFPQLISILPCWAITSLSARGRLPFVAGFFDLLVIDEASQCDIASAIPLLFRAKKVVIIGDPKQLRHVSSLPIKMDRQLLEKHDLVENRAAWAYSVNSAFDLASGLCLSEDIVSLRDHHRSHADIIEFSNRNFYEGRLRIATRYEKLRFLNHDDPAIRWIDVRGRVKRPSSGGAINEEEAKAVVAELERLVIKQNYQGSIGVVSPFRMQFQRINELVRLNDALLNPLIERDFLAYTAHGFQGDERDLMIFSPVVSLDTPSGALGFLRNNPNLFNVAITRARSVLVVVGDKQAAADSKVDFLSSFVEYVATLGRKRQEYSKEARDLGAEYPKVARPELVSNWEKIFYRFLYGGGLRPIPQYELEKYILDLALIDGERRLDIEVDGEHYHKNWDGELSLRDQIRNQRIIELGWDVMRFWVYQIRDDIDACISRVKKWQQH
jgi:very-short-patch-repair endonuclease